MMKANNMKFFRKIKYLKKKKEDILHIKQEVLKERENLKNKFSGAHKDELYEQPGNRKF